MTTLLVNTALPSLIKTRSLNPSITISLNMIISSSILGQKQHGTLRKAKYGITLLLYLESELHLPDNEITDNRVGTHLEFQLNLRRQESGVLCGQINKWG